MEIQKWLVMPSMSMNFLKFFTVLRYQSKTIGETISSKRRVWTLMTEMNDWAHWRSCLTLIGLTTIDRALTIRVEFLSWISHRCRKSTIFQITTLKVCLIMIVTWIWQRNGYNSWSSTLTYHQCSKWEKKVSLTSTKKVSISNFLYFHTFDIEKSKIQKLLSSQKISPRTGTIKDEELEKWVDQERRDIDRTKKIYEENMKVRV